MGIRWTRRWGGLVALLVLVACLPESPARAAGAVTGPYTEDPAAIAVAGADWRQQVLDISNGYRKVEGRKPLVLCDTLNDSAQGWANYMAGNLLFAHDAPDGSREWDRMILSGYQPAFQPSGENLSLGTANAQGAVDIWTTDPIHYGIMTDASYVDMGVGVALGSDGQLYWAVNYGIGGSCTRAAAKYDVSATIEATPGVAATIGPISVGTSTVRASLPKGAYGTVKLFSEPSRCVLPNQKGRTCSTVTLDLVTKGPDGTNLYSAAAPVPTVFTCERAVCPPPKQASSRRYDPVKDFRAYPLKISLKRNGAYLPERIAPPCQSLTSRKRATGTLGTKQARTLGFCADVYAYKRVNGVLYRTALFVEDPRFASISR